MVRSANALLRARHRGLIARTRKHLGPAALSAPRALMLWVVHRMQPVTIKALSEHLYQSKSTVSAAADNLVRAGLVRRTRPAEDRRLVVLRLSRRGEDAIRATVAARERLLARALRRARGIPAARLVCMLSEVLRALEETAAPRRAATTPPPRRAAVRS
jgi:DNA-binding MarR family transcriptional regulator